MPVPQEVLNVGENVAVTFSGHNIIVTFNGAHRGGLSASGKTVRVASTLGNVKLPNGIVLGVNAYVKP